MADELHIFIILSDPQFCTYVPLPADKDSRWK